jgi:hypothetical protein
MLNLADFSMLLMAIIGPVSAFGAAHGHKASVPALIVFAVGGLALGLSFGIAVNKFAYRVLNSKTRNGGLALLAYMTVPLLGIVTVGLVPFLIAQIIYGRV